MRISIRTFVLVVVLKLTSLAGGVAIGNGGDAIQCAGDPALYTLDYVQGRSFFKNKSSIYAVKSLPESFENILKLLETNVAALAPSFRLFVSQIGNTDQASPYWWKENIFIDDIRDENVSSFSFYCRNSKGGVSIHQAVIRHFDSATGQVRFDYNSRVINLLSPVQLSFLYVHEWLWSHCTDVNSIRNINYFLHSSQIHRMPTSQIRRQLIGLGLAECR